MFELLPGLYLIHLLILILETIWCSQLLTDTERKSREICSNFSIMILIGLVISVLEKRSDPQKYKIKVKPCAVIIDLERALDGSGWIDVRIGHSVRIWKKQW